MDARVGGLACERSRARRAPEGTPRGGGRLGDGPRLRLERLPLHHRDPFDRILIAQSLEEGFPILTADPLLKNYSAALIW